MRSGAGGEEGDTEGAGEEGDSEGAGKGAGDSEGELIVASSARDTATRATETLARRAYGRPHGPLEKTAIQRC